MHNLKNKFYKNELNRSYVYITNLHYAVYMFVTVITLDAPFLNVLVQ
jgi:hypothetical protein